MADGPLSHRKILIAGAGLAGLSAARELERMGAEVDVFEARDRVGGRVQTMRGVFRDGQHAEAGADIIEAEQTMVLDLARELNLATTRILRRGFGLYGEVARGRRRLRHAPDAFADAEERLRQEVADYCLADKRWDSAIAGALARQSVAEWLASIRADRRLRGGMKGLRGFFLADPEDLSLLPLVDQFAGGGAPGKDRMFRISEGNDRLPAAVAASLRAPIRLKSILRRVSQHSRGVVVTVDEAGGRHEVRGDYLVIALPAATLREVSFRPRLPVQQASAIRGLRYGHATRLLLQYERPFWRTALRPRAFGTDLPVGALWDASEGQGGGAAILSLLAGGTASPDLQAILDRESPGGVSRRLRWLGTPAPLVAAVRVTWEDDPWSRGGYAYFDPGFDPALRAWLARPSGRVVFAGEHTSVGWQGFMNGAIESGRRAAAEIRAMSGARA
jgi:monoamine oxidase